MKWTYLAAAGLAMSAPPLQAMQAPQAADRAAPQQLRIEIERLTTDRGYAQRSMAEIDAFQTRHGQLADHPFLLLLRANALAGLDRREEAAEAIDRLLASGEASAAIYGYLWRAAGRISNPARMVAVVEAAARNLPAEHRQDLHGYFSRGIVEAVSHHFILGNQRQMQVRLSEALFVLGWPGERDIFERDSVRFAALERRRRSGDTAAAAEIARTIEVPEILLPLLVRRRYDGLLPTGAPLPRIEAAIVRADASTRAALEASPRNAAAANRRVGFLRLVGRPAEALAAAQPFLADAEATARRDRGNWLVNEAVYALLDLGRRDDAVALMARLAAMDLSENPELVSQTINHIAVLRRAGRLVEALIHAQRIDVEALPHVAPYGRMWIASGMVCALSDLGRSREAADRLARMREQEQVNAAALSRAYLCLGDLDAAEALLLRRLGAEGGDALLVDLQAYERTSADERDDPIARRWAELRERPAVREAIERAGRILRLPLAKTYWGAY